MKSKKPNISEFGSVAKVRKVIDPMQDIERVRALDRAQIDGLFNGQRPYTEDECKRFNINLNVNWGSGKRIMLDANRQLNSALLHPGTLFVAYPEDAPPAKGDVWSQVFSKNIQEPMRKGKSGKLHMYTIQSRNASVCLHGIGALLWSKREKWLPRFIPLEDLLIPTETLCDFSNLRYFAVNLYLSPGEFCDMTQGDNVLPGWNQKMCSSILEQMKFKVDPQSTPNDIQDRPEDWVSIVKQNKGFYYSDAVEKVKLRCFYWQEVDGARKWHRHIILKDSSNWSTAEDLNQFVYNGNGEVFADDVGEILHIQYGDANLVPPMKFHEVRGLGVDLYAPYETLNRYQCQFMQHCFEQLLTIFRLKDPADKDRLKQVVLSAYGVIPEGLDFVKGSDRNPVDPNLASAAMNIMSQIMQESSSAYVRDTDNGSGKEMTAKEATIRLNQANVMVGSMLLMMYVQEGYYYQELVRRFCTKGSVDPQVEAFQKKCLKAGIPPEFVYDPTKWDVTPERVIGGGDKTQAQMQAQWLWQNQTAYSPQSQQIIKRMVTGVMLDDPAKAALLVPEAPEQSTDGSRTAEDLFGTLMEGIQVPQRNGIDPQGYIVRMLAMMQSVVQKIQKTSNVGSMDDCIGLGSCVQNVSQYLQVLAQDPMQKQFVKQASDQLAQIVNELKGFFQRIQEEQQKGQQDPEAQAKIQTLMQTAQVKSQINQANAAMKARQKELSFKFDEQRKNLQMLSDIKRQDMKAHAELMNQQASDALELMHQERMAKIESDNVKVKVDTN